MKNAISCEKVMNSSLLIFLCFYTASFQGNFDELLKSKDEIIKSKNEIIKNKDDIIQNKLQIIELLKRNDSSTNPGEYVDKNKYTDLELKYNQLLRTNNELQTKLNENNAKYNVLLKENEKFSDQIRKYKSQIVTLKNQRRSKNAKHKLSRKVADDSDENMTSFSSTSASESESDDDYSPPTRRSNKTTSTRRSTRHNKTNKPSNKSTNESSNKPSTKEVQRIVNQIQRGYQAPLLWKGETELTDKVEPPSRAPRSAFCRLTLSQTVRWVLWSGLKAPKTREPTESNPVCCTVAVLRNYLSFSWVNTKGVKSWVERHGEEPSKGVLTKKEIDDFNGNTFNWLSNGGDLPKNCVDFDSIPQPVSRGVTGNEANENQNHNHNNNQNPVAEMQIEENEEKEDEPQDRDAETEQADTDL